MIPITIVTLCGKKKLATKVHKGKHKGAQRIFKDHDLLTYFNPVFMGGNRSLSSEIGNTNDDAEIWFLVIYPDVFVFVQ
jgi:hypothetical protein